MTPGRRLRFGYFPVGDQEVGGSNPLAPTILFPELTQTYTGLLLILRLRKSCPDLSRNGIFAFSGSVKPRPTLAELGNTQDQLLAKRAQARDLKRTEKQDEPIPKCCGINLVGSCSQRWGQERLPREHAPLEERIYEKPGFFGVNP